MRKELALGISALSLIVATANAFDFGVEFSVGHHEFKTTENYNGVQKLKKQGGYGAIDLLLSHSIKGFFISGKAGIYGSPNGDMDLDVAKPGYSLRYTDSDFEFAGYRFSVRAGYEREVYKGFSLGGFGGWGYDKRKEDVSYTAIEDTGSGPTQIDGSYSDEYKYVYWELGAIVKYRIFYLQGSILFPIKDEIKMDKSYAGLGHPTADMGNKKGYNLEAGIRWKFLKASLFYQERKHDRFTDPVNGRMPQSKEEWMGASLGFIF